MGLETFDTSKMYLSIIAGTLTQKVDEGTPGAVKREYETSDGGKGTKWELHYKAVSGYISAISFKDTDFGEQLVIEITSDEDKFQISTGLDGRYFTDFAKKISNIYLDLPVRISPYDFEDKGKRRTGLSITQEGAKIESYFWDAEKKKAVNGIPLPTGDTKKYDKDDWKMYFITVKKFLKQHVLDVWSAQPAHNEAEAEPQTELTENDDF